VNDLIRCAVSSFMRRTWRFAVLVGIGLSSGSALAMVIGSIFLAENALRVPDHTRSSMLSAQAFAQGAKAIGESAQVRASDGALLDAWLFTPAHPNGSAVVLLHGVGDTRTGVLGQARLLLDAGYSVLTPDSRAHGASAEP
jgi:uncharacterized protein